MQTKTNLKLQKMANFSILGIGNKLSQKHLAVRLMTEEKIAELIKRAKDGSVSAFEELVLMHEKKLFAFAMSITGGNYSVSDDLYQDALIKAFTRIDQFKPKYKFSAWLWQIAKNCYYDYLKSPKVKKTVSIDDMNYYEPVSNDNVDENFSLGERKQNLHKLIEKLSENDQEVITLIDFIELTYEESAEILGVSVNSVKVRIHRARDRLAKLAMKNEELFL